MDENHEIDWEERWKAHARETMAFGVICTSCPPGRCDCAKRDWIEHEKIREAGLKPYLCEFCNQHVDRVLKRVAQKGSKDICVDCAINPKHD